MKQGRCHINMKVNTGCKTLKFSLWLPSCRLADENLNNLHDNSKTEFSHGKSRFYHTSARWNLEQTWKTPSPKSKELEHDNNEHDSPAHNILLLMCIIHRASIIYIWHVQIAKYHIAYIPLKTCNAAIQANSTSCLLWCYPCTNPVNLRSIYYTMLT